MRRAALFAMAAALVPACSKGADVSPWIELAQGFRPASAEGVRAFETASGRRVELRTEGEHGWLSVRVGRDEWRRNAALDSWEAPLVLHGHGRPGDGSPPQRLTDGVRSFEYYPPTNLVPGFEIEPSSFLHMGERLRLKLPDGEEPPEEVTLSLFAGRGAERDGRWRVPGTRFAGDGLVVWPGERVELEVDVPPASALRFATAFEPAPSAGGVSLVFRVRVDGEVVLRHAEPDLERAAARWHTVDLGARSGRRDLVFEVEGPLAYSSFLAPVVGPATPRRQPGSRPDLVLFQADTFRADNMALYGGTAGVTPALDALAARGTRFLRAWSTSTYTLPAHASLFTGLHPRQAGIVGPGRTLSPGWPTVAELLRRAGYRTGAVTDAVMVSQRFGLDRGFGWWDEHRDPLDSTFERARAFLDAGDGRPTFLFVQSYRVHAPYEVSEETRRERGAALGLEGTFEELSEERLTVARGQADRRRTTEELRALGERFRAFYLGGVADFDRGFAGFAADLEERGLFEGGVLVFTSDHGEAFGEHGELFHSGDVHEEQTRVPLFLVGRGMEERVVERAVSLVDLPPTLAELAGLEPLAGWVGRSLLARDVPADRPVFAFQCWGAPGTSTLALVQDGRKVITVEDAAAVRAGGVQGAYDLVRDPGEATNLAGEEWARELLERLAPRVLRSLEPLFEVREADLGADDLRELEAMGYGGEVGG